jgi:hypothetical protein
MPATYIEDEVLGLITKKYVKGLLPKGSVPLGKFKYALEKFNPPAELYVNVPEARVAEIFATLSFQTVKEALFAGAVPVAFGSELSNQLLIPLIRRGDHPTTADIILLLKLIVIPSFLFAAAARAFAWVGFVAVLETILETTLLSSAIVKRALPCEAENRVDDAPAPPETYVTRPWIPASTANC